MLNLLVFFEAFAQGAPSDLAKGFLTDSPNGCYGEVTALVNKSRVIPGRESMAMQLC